MQQVKMIFLLAIGSLFWVACGAGRVEIVRERDSDLFNITVELNEDDVAQLVEEALTASGNPLLRSPMVDLQDGQIEVTGQHERRDGSGQVNGRILLIPSAQNGHLVLTATEINLEGTDVSDERIQQFNENLAARISGRAEQRTRNITLNGVTVTNDLLTLTLDAARNN